MTAYYHIIVYRTSREGDTVAWLGVCVQFACCASLLWVLRVTYRVQYRDMHFGNLIVPTDHTLMH